MPVVRHIARKKKKKNKKRRRINFDDDYFPSLKNVMNIKPCNDESLIEIQEQLEKGLEWKDERVLITHQDWTDPSWRKHIDGLGPDGRLIVSLLVMGMDAQLPGEFFKAVMSSEKVKSIIQKQGITQSKTLMEDLC